MAVTEALMSLFLKESVSTSRVLNTVRRMDKNKTFDGDNGDLDNADPEEALVLWVSEACRALKKKAMDEVGKADKDSDQVRREGEDLACCSEYRVVHLVVDNLLLK